MFLVHQAECNLDQVALLLSQRKILVGSGTIYVFYTRLQHLRDAALRDDGKLYY